MMYVVKKFVLLHPQSCLGDIPEPDTRQQRSKMPTVKQNPEIGRNQFLENSPWTPLFRKQIFLIWHKCWVRKLSRYSGVRTCLNTRVVGKDSRIDFCIIDNYTVKFWWTLYRQKVSKCHLRQPQIFRFWF